MTMTGALHTPGHLSCPNTGSTEHYALKLDDTTGRGHGSADDSSIAGLIAALKNQQHFTREQAAWLMSQAMRWGYEQRDDEDSGFWAGYWHRVAEENAEAREEQLVFNGGATIRAGERQARREEWDAAASLPRPGDFRGLESERQAAA